MPPPRALQFWSHEPLVHKKISNSDFVWAATIPLSKQAAEHNLRLAGAKRTPGRDKHAPRVGNGSRLLVCTAPGLGFFVKFPDGPICTTTVVVKIPDGPICTTTVCENSRRTNLHDHRFCENSRRTNLHDHRLGIVCIWQSVADLALEVVCCG